MAAMLDKKENQFPRPKFPIELTTMLGDAVLLHQIHLQVTERYLNDTDEKQAEYMKHIWPPIRFFEESDTFQKMKRSFSQSCGEILKEKTSHKVKPKDSESEKVVEHELEHLSLV